MQKAKKTNAKQSKKNSLKFKIFAIAFLAVFTLIGGAALILSPALAEEEDQYPPIVQNLAEKFNVQKQEVQLVFEDTRKQHQEQRLSEAVDSGKITEEQKNLIIQRHEEMRNKVEEINSQKLSQKERHEKLEKLREENRNWHEENDIPFFGKGPERQEGKGMMNNGKGMGTGNQMSMRMGS